MRLASITSRTTLLVRHKITTRQNRTKAASSVCQLLNNDKKKNSHFNSSCFVQQKQKLLDISYCNNTYINKGEEEEKCDR